MFADGNVLLMDQYRLWNRGIIRQRFAYRHDKLFGHRDQCSGCGQSRERHRVGRKFGGGQLH